MAAIHKYLKIIDQKGNQHIVPDNTKSRRFHIDYATKAQAADKPKSIELVTGKYVDGDSPGSHEFEVTEVLEVLFENLTPQDSQLEAANAENDTLKEQIALLQKQLAEKGSKGPKGGKGGKKGEEGSEVDEDV